MKKGLKIFFVALAVLLVLSIVVYIRLAPLREYHHNPPYKGTNNFIYTSPIKDSTKKNILIMADNNMTELFDLLTPFYLFNVTGKANVYIVAQKKYPITTENGPYVLPHLSYSEIDSLNLHPDVIVIPYMHHPESSEKTEWLCKHYNDSVIVLSICDGAWTAAATGIYDDVSITSHATGYEKIREKYTRPNWVQNVTYTEQNNLFSTGGVSNATDGSLAVIQKLFGMETMQQVMSLIHYPYKNLNHKHKSVSLSLSSKSSAFLKMMFRKNKNIGVLMQNGMNEMKLATVFDFYARTMPSFIQGVTLDNKIIVTKHGLQIVITENLDLNNLDELHVLHPEKISSTDFTANEDTEVVLYDKRQNEYIIDICINRLKNIYPNSFVEFVKLTLDYN